MMPMPCNAKQCVTRITGLIVFIVMSFLVSVSSPALEKPAHITEAEVKEEAQRGFEAILDLWRDEKYEELLARTIPCSGKRGKKLCEEEVWHLTRRPACCWEKTRDVSVTFVDEKKVLLKATIGLESKLFGTRSITKTFYLIKEDGVWKVPLEDIISLGK